MNVDDNSDDQGSDVRSKLHPKHSASVEADKQKPASVQKYWTQSCTEVVDM